MDKVDKLLYRVGESYTGKQFLLKRLLYGFVAFLICISISISMHEKNKETLVNSPALYNKIRKSNSKDTRSLHQDWS